MGMVMVKCPQTGRAIPTGLTIDREGFRRSAVFFSRTHCPICRADHMWFAQDAWVDEPNTLPPCRPAKPQQSFV
ncbi:MULTISPECIES: hypothetical protein [unclassified Bradyrhizobium]|uniref:hypothetical protein n=1 Tax=unclassified Bradyrhizobium TaxID=2631580 RepID=UPI0024788C38|nr:MULTISPECIES: hypothetical protein [unclassified Bradyrhizobium]WGR93244.1 hypothetical protein MTX20_36710 [Bradyrhizobium sp. ISRA435]WGR97768.1 hypothetical protein MTX23_25745 [Bradyrhizobium sp. ISRA436]WGS04657.1 hypothetical protein MTX18_25750 [Bradyrhizobium sp. ISRA437]WGS11538.1 hypothetical protein MTX26_25750 [Bradyrhizobium sp. ISRA443]WGS19024.1 hypothetical protein MTX22_31685 [Bradyrhizobium sp. ISRA463]